jgi:hypothetical protein
MELNPNPERSLSTENPWKSALQSPWENLTRFNPNLENRADFKELRDWYDTQASRLPNFTVSDAPLESDAWNTIYSIKEESRGKVLEIRRDDGEFFTIRGVRCTKTDPETGKVIYQWIQPVLECKENSIDFNMYDKDTNLPFYGLLAVIRDTEGNLLIDIDQEVTSENKNNSVARLPVQASSGKIAKMLAGDKSADRGLADLMDIYGCKDFNELLKTADEILPIAPEDTNRDIKHNLALMLTKIDSSSEMHQRLVASGKRKWLTPEQWDMIVVARLSNSHTTACVSLVEKADRLKKLQALT